MKKIIIFAILIVMILETISCDTENEPGVVSEKSEGNTTEITSEELYETTTAENSDATNIDFIDENGDVTRPFSYKMDLEYMEEMKSRLEDPSTFKNTTETEVNTRKKAIEVAKNELIWQYNGPITVGYDKSYSMWYINFSFNYWDNQSIYLDSKGITKIIKREFFTLDDGVVLCSFESSIKKFELLGGMRRDPNEFKNTTETKVKTKEDAIELAKNELPEGYEYDRIFVSYYDPIWGVIFWSEETDDKLSRGQYIYLDNKGITQVVLTVPFIFDYYNQHIEFLEKRGGIQIDPSEFKNTTKTHIDFLGNLRAEIIELAKNELTEGYEYREIAVYFDYSNDVYVASFWSDDTFTKGEHIFIDNDGITKLIIHTG